MDKRQKVVERAGGPTSLCSKCRLLDLSYVGFHHDRNWPTENYRLSFTLAEAAASAAHCWICGWLASLADDKDFALATRIHVGFDIYRFSTLEPPAEWKPWDEQTKASHLYFYIDCREAGGKFEYKGAFQKSGGPTPVHVSAMLNHDDPISVAAKVDPYTARLRPPIVDMRIFKIWMDQCTSHHGSICGKTRFMSRSINSMRFIDVIDDCIVESANDVEWVALSYVWGEAQEHALQKGNFTSYHQPGSLAKEMVPPTIRDAMAVTRAMGERFLWVDSLCIIQDDDEDKLRNIPAMGIIYGQAVVTIISAAGEKVSSPIPGVQEGSPRSVQETFEINGTWLVSALDTPHAGYEGYLQNCKWNTRGWTYQECLLPSRCLIFDTEQVYWQCHRASWCEDAFWEQDARDAPIIYRHCLGKSEMLSLLEDKSKDWSSLFSIVLNMYLTRQLTSQGDRLAALSGILSVLEKSTGQRFFWGMPENHLEFALSWTTDDPAIPRNTACQVAAPGGPASPFPSWSWTGWLGSQISGGTGSYDMGLLGLRFYRIDYDSNPIPIQEDMDANVSQWNKDVISALGTDTVTQPRYPANIEHSWMDKCKTEITVSHIPSSIRLSDAAPSLLCFWTSTAILKIKKEPTGSPPIPKIGITDGKTEIHGFWGWTDFTLEEEEGKFLVIGAKKEKMSHGGRLLLTLMFVEVADDTVCYRRHIVRDLPESAWLKLENRKWEMVCLG
ncbi:hypothetical protein LHYA1_G000592 [Lachnellula hyalina]|uniref:Heterokaryon incompatibility domain-containing protein n=1 Tax=Lachnellula hyalina TaxID=1316788 RepID=A0A8H8U3Q2_9HELO|nr:uncharacterized protein LHYA1_G000592 [Lachnellula hyalina]TVY30522.1 hypothetical protein LHYA1_G000592 [Lachnellula hyalina]